MKLQEVSETPKVNPKGLAKMQLMMMSADIVNELDKNTEEYKTKLGEQGYFELVAELGKILNKEGEASWSFLENGFRVLNNLKKD
jgi:hypothetical protein